MKRPLTRSSPADNGQSLPLWYPSRRDIVPASLKETRERVSGKSSYSVIVSAVFLSSLLLVVSTAILAVSPSLSTNDSLQFFRAIRTGDIATVEQFVRMGIDVNTTFEPAKTGMRAGRSALQAASESNQYEVAKYLIRRGASVSDKGNFGVPPLALAARAGAENIVELLVAKGADTNDVDELGVTPLMSAAARDHYRVAKFLITKGANVNARSKAGYTVLHAAASGGGKELVELLIRSGANVNARTNDGTTPLRLNAESHYYADVANVLLSNGADPNLADGDNRTPLNWAITKCHMATAELLLTKGADVTTIDKLGMTPLHWAISRSSDSRCKQRESLKIVQLLLLNGARVDVADNRGRTPISLAADKQEMLTLLNSAKSEGDTKKAIASFQPELTTKHVATLYGKKIYVDDVRPPLSEINSNKTRLPDEQFRQWLHGNEKRYMERSIWLPLKLAHIEEYRITATDDEMLDALTVFSAQTADRPRSGRTSERRKEYAILTPIMRGAAYQLVTNWKFDKALYERFGGRVFFEESKEVGRPLESYRRFIAEKERSADLRFHDEDIRAAFYERFAKPKDESKVLPANYYAKPYWDKN